MTATGTIIKTVPTIQSISLLKDNIKYLKKKKKKNIVKQSMRNIVGINLIKTQADIAGTID